MRFPRREPAPLRRALRTLPLLLAACCALASFFPGLLSTGARAASTFVVNSTGDGADSNTSDGLCADAAGKCTLRAAIEQANAAPGPDTVNFQIGAGAQTIAVGSALPGVTDHLTIDATTQPGFDGSPLVVLSGGGLPIDGLRYVAAGGSVRGLVINGFRLAALSIGGAGSVVTGNYIGTDAAGAAAVGNGTGIVATGGVLVGGTTPAARNVISGGPSDAPDTNFSGFDFWLAKLNSFSLPGEDVRDAAVAAARAARAEMSRAFVESFEYRQRFGRP